MLPKPRKYIPGVLTSQHQAQTYGVISLSRMASGCPLPVITRPPMPQQYHCFPVDPYRIPTGHMPKKRSKGKSFEQEQLDNLNGATWGLHGCNT